MRGRESGHPGIGRVYSDPDNSKGSLAESFATMARLGLPSRPTPGVSRWSTTPPADWQEPRLWLWYFNEDRILDVVANDQVRNLFLLSEGDTFIDRALARGFAYDRRGKPSAAMGIDVDFDLATQEHRVVMGNFNEEMTSVYVNAEGATSFIDESVAEGIGPRTNARTTFGALFVDYDNDGTAISLRSMARFGRSRPSSSRARWGFHTGNPAISSGIAVVAAAPPTSTSGGSPVISPSALWDGAWLRRLWTAMVTVISSPPSGQPYRTETIPKPANAR